MGSRIWKVGELAKLTGLSIRTLHYYEEIGLLGPSSRTESKHRVFSERDVGRLQQILSLKTLGLPLDEIKRCLDDHKMTSLQIVQMHRSRVEGEKKRVERLYSLLTRLETALEKKTALSIDELLKTIEEMTMYEKYLTKEQLEKISKRRTKIGEEGIKKTQAEWVKLIASMRSAMERDTDPNDPKVQKLALRWQELVEEFTGGDTEIGLGLRELYKNEPTVQERFGMDPKLMDYVGKTMYYLSKTAIKKMSKRKK